MADEPQERPPVEAMPSRAGDISALASAQAPFIYFDMAPTFGCLDGIVNVTLEAVRHQLPNPSVGVVSDRVVVAHLRMSVPAATVLRDVLNQALLLAAPAASGQKN